MLGARWLRDAIDLVVPVRCVGCHRRAESWCLDCRAAALDLRLRTLDGGLLVAAAASYDDDVREAILEFKERGRRDLARPLAWLLTASVEAAASGLEQPLVVPMPSTPRASRRRGGEHLPRLAKRSIEERPIVFVLGTRGGADSAELSASGRQIARRQGMYARSGAKSLVTGRDLLLVDDIVTTGATLARAAEILRSLGAREVRAAVVAETEKQVSGR